MRVKVNLPTELVNRTLSEITGNRNDGFVNLISRGTFVNHEVMVGSKLLIEKRSGKLTQVTFQ